MSTQWIRILVKGNEKIALEHAIKNDIHNCMLDSHSDNDRETSLICPDNEQNTTAVMAWFTNTKDYGINAPFQPGTCLWYGWS